LKNSDAKRKGAEVTFHAVGKKEGNGKNQAPVGGGHVKSYATRKVSFCPERGRKSRTPEKMSG